MTCKQSLWFIAVLTTLLWWGPLAYEFGQHLAEQSIGPFQRMQGAMIVFAITFIVVAFTAMLRAWNGRQ